MAINPRDCRYWLLLCLLASLPHVRQATAQSMAHPGWAGSGPIAQPWWQRAVFYRIDPLRFQASGRGSTGDLAGVTFRLDYLQSLGVDALVLDPASDAGVPLAVPLAAPSATRLDPDALENLIREASRHNLRVVPALTPALAYGDRNTLLRIVHEWLGEGAAGIALPKPLADSAREADAYVSLVSLLANVLRGTPGDRVLLTGPVSAQLPPAPPALTEHDLPDTQKRTQNRVRNRTGYLGQGSGRLTAVAVLPAEPTEAAILRSALAPIPANNSSPAATSDHPLLRLSAVPPDPGVLPAPYPASAFAAQNTFAAAAALLASKAAVLFDFGAEIGLNTSARDPAGAARLMQWTPANMQRAPLERTDPSAVPPAPGQLIPFGPYKPFVQPPPRSLTGNLPAGPAVEVDRNLPPPPPDPDSLPGFTTGTLPGTGSPGTGSPGTGSVVNGNGATVNVATEERDPRSNLNAFRTLLALRHGNAALRQGAQIVLNHDAENTLVLLRRLPPGARTAGAVVVAANLGSLPVQISLNSDLDRLGLRPGPLRALFSYGPGSLTGESTSALRLPAHAVFVGELRR